MSTFSPTREGFRCAFRRPSLTFAEITWRWTIGATEIALLLFGSTEYLSTVHVSKVDELILRSKQVPLVVRVLERIFRGTGSRAMLAGLLAVFALSLLWAGAASVGRLTTLRVLLDYFRVSADSAVDSDSRGQFAGLRSLFGLSFLRVAALLAALLAFAGAAILADLVSSAAKAQPGLGFLIFMPLIALICLLWAGIDWLLSFASVFVASRGEDALGAISTAVTFVQEKAGSIFAVSVWNAFSHFVVFVGGFSFATIVLLFVHVLPTLFVATGLALLALGYFAVIDWLYIARLAGYVSITEIDGLSSAALLAPPSSEAPKLEQRIPAETAIDRSEVILSDFPGLAFEP
jgi:hypothetical protein